MVEASSTWSPTTKPQTLTHNAPWTPTSTQMNLNSHWWCQTNMRCSQRRKTLSQAWIRAVSLMKASQFVDPMSRATKLTISTKWPRSKPIAGSAMRWIRSFLAWIRQRWIGTVNPRRKPIVIFQLWETLTRLRAIHRWWLHFRQRTFTRIMLLVQTCETIRISTGQHSRIKHPPWSHPSVLILTSCVSWHQNT